MPLSFNDFCFVFSLQAGVVATSTIGFTVMVITFMLNLYAPNSMESGVQICQYICLYIYLIIMMVAFGMAFLASFWEKPKFIKMSANILILGTLLYFILSIISYIREGNAMEYVCPEMRCPDHHWLQDSRWRAVYIAMEAEREKEDNETDNKADNTTDNKTTYRRSISRPFEVLEMVHFNDDDWQRLSNDTDEGEGSNADRPSKRPREKDVLILMFVSFVYSTSFLVYDVYAIITLFAFASQIENS